MYSVKEALMVRYTVKIMPNREDAGIILKTLFGQNLERPEALARNGVARRTIAKHGCARRCFNELLGFAGIMAKLLWGHGINPSMPVAVAGYFVLFRDYTSDQLRIPFCHPAQDKEGGFDVLLIEQG